MTEEKSLESLDKTNTANIIYILYLVGIAVGITGLIGLIMAYVYRGDAPDWLKTHYRFQIRTFWIGMLYGFIGLALIFVFVGYFVLLFNLVWFVVRCVKGMNYLGRKEAHPNPAGWLF